MKVNEIKTGEPFRDLFRIYDEVYREVLADIEQNGYDQNEPILVWKEKGIVIDGHTRLKAAQDFKVKDIPVILLSFADEDEAVRYAIKRNANRRFVTMGDKFRCFMLVDKKEERRGRTKEERQNRNIKSNISNVSHEKTAKILGVSPSQIQKMRLIIDWADHAEIDLEKVENDEISIDAASRIAKETKERIEAEMAAEKKKESSFNRTNDNIEWALWTWNPVTGCRHGCEYCYARDIANRFFKEKFEPTFHEKRLSAPKNTPIPKEDVIGEHNVFVCSMADLFGDWVPDEWIEAVFKAIEESPEWWNYLFLTKNPRRYLDLDFPRRCWIGATGDVQGRVNLALEVFREMRKNGVENKFFLSCEPLMERVSLGDDPVVDWVIIGGRSRSSGMPEGQPEWEWVETLEDDCAKYNIPRYWKPNLTVRPRQYPELEG